MPSLKFSQTLMYPFLFSLFCLTIDAAPTYLFHFCDNTANFTPSDTHQSSQNLLLSTLSLSSEASSVKNGFYKYSTAGLKPLDILYSDALCRGDITISSTCQDCVRTATREIVQRCPTQKRAIIWYDECLLRFSNQNFFSTGNQNPSIILMNTQNMTEATRFNELVLTTMNDIANQAANDPSGTKKFATKEANFTTLQTLYTLGQCTPDLSSSACNGCLRYAIATLPNSRGGRVLTPSCNVRYEIYQFYEMVAPAPVPTPVVKTNEMVAPTPVPTPVVKTKGKEGVSPLTIIAIVAPNVVVIFAIGRCFLTWMARKKQGNCITTAESSQFDLATIQVATNNFSDDNKLGEGGFGVVYKGTLPNGQEIAVKRLSQSSGQGGEEFKNEAVLVGKLQHRNLVRLLGFCLEGEEKILAYEFVPNKSLDYFLFDLENQGQLDWSKRYKIIGGIARGILYLHEDSRLRIIHRDLKASNILLDGDMNPKVSDFGMARTFGVNQTQGNTSRIIGTYGYMSPEYAKHGQFSAKSDVYSFGVLVLEILSGKKINFYHSDNAEDLLSFAWKHWSKGTPLEVLDSTLMHSYSRNEAIRCLNIGLLCAQENPDDRPAMASIVPMLSSYSVTLPLPQHPPFFLRGRIESIPWSVNEASITEVYPR